MSNSKSQNKLDFGRDANDFLRSIEKNADNSNARLPDEGIHIVSLVSNDGGTVKVRVLVENESGSENMEFSLLCEFVNELGLLIGDIDSETASDIERYAEVTRAYASACSSLAFADSSCRALERKLLQKGFDRDISEDAVGVVLSRGLIDENNIVESRIRVFLGKRWGRARIIAKLREEGFCNGAIKHALETLSEVDFISLCAECLQRKYPMLPTERKDLEKIYASLSRYGYSSSEIRDAIKMLADE